MYYSGIMIGPTLSTSSWGNCGHCKVCHWTVGRHLHFLSSSTASRKTLVLVIYALTRIDIHVSSVPSGFVFDVQCSLRKQTSIICWKDFTEKGQGKDSPASLMFAPWISLSAS